MSPKSKPVAPPDLYCITDTNLSSLSLEEQVNQMVEGGARMVQLRDKNADDGHLRLAAQKCLSICHWEEVLFIVNDRVEVAASIGADGVHLGQGDTSPAEARRVLGEDSVIGLSTHNPEQFNRALEQPVDYIAIGPVYGTTTKDNPDPATGLDFVREAARRLEGDHRPLVLIGGITLEKVPELREVAPKAFIAVISDLYRGKTLVERVRQFRKTICCEAS